MSLMPAFPPPKSNADRSGAQNVWRGVSRSDTSVSLSQPSFGAAPMEPPRLWPELTQQRPRNHHSLDFRGALINFCDARIPEMPLDVQLFRVAHAAVDLDRLVGDAVGRLARIELRHARFARVPDARVLEARGA